ncbi:MAG: DUF1579 family protein [Acidobacteriota bacterium]
MASARRFSITAVLVAVFCSLVAVMAQEKAEMPYTKPTPAAEMQKLYFQLGDWKVVEKHESMPGFPGGDGKGAIKARKGPGGLSVETDYNGTGPIGSFVGKGIVTWDAEEKVYKSYWFDNFQAGGFVTAGKWEGNDLVLTGEAKMNGQKFLFKQVYTDITPTSYTSKVYMGEGNQMTLVFTMKATHQ